MDEQDVGGTVAHCRYLPFGFGLIATGGRLFVNGKNAWVDIDADHSNARIKVIGAIVTGALGRGTIADLDACPTQECPGAIDNMDK
jgi:hypothetical protein